MHCLREALRLAALELDYAADALADRGALQEARNAAERAMEARDALRHDTGESDAESGARIEVEP